MMESFVENLKERGNAPDVATTMIFLFISYDFMVVGGPRMWSFPYRKWTLRNRIEDWQADELKAAASNHKHVLFLFFFLCAATHGINCVLPKYQNEPSILLLKFFTKCCWATVSYVVLYKFRAVLRRKAPLETTVKTTAAADELGRIL